MERKIKRNNRKKKIFDSPRNVPKFDIINKIKKLKEHKRNKKKTNVKLKT